MVHVLCALGVQGKEIVWFDGLHPITYQMPKEVEPVVQVAMEMWKDDMRQVTGMTPVASDKAVIRMEHASGSPM